MLVIVIISTFMGLFAYKRYIPVFGISAVLENKLENDSVLLDLRDYQTSYNKPIKGSINIPFAYLKRYYKEIPNKKILILASDTIEKNLAIRFLLRRGFSISGFMILNRKWG
ncbi:MAG: hypothetical protein Q8934_05800 [Bacillota bacterium]|nr:hypothetical protein [Bacillota bacterium]